MVPVVVVHGHAGRLALPFEAPSDAGERGGAREHGLRREIQRPSRRDDAQRIGDVVASGRRQADGAGLAEERAAEELHGRAVGVGRGDPREQDRHGIPAGGELLRESAGEAVEPLRGSVDHRGEDQRARPRADQPTDRAPPRWGRRRWR